MNIVLIDDDIKFLKIFKSKVKGYAKKIFSNFNIDISLDISILEKNIYSIYFLDIDLINENGIDVAKKIKKENSNAKVIFTTSKNDLIYKAISIQPFYFIRKSDLETDLATAFILIEDYFLKKKFYSFKYEQEKINLYIEDIIYFEINDHLITIYTNSKQYYLYKPLKQLINEIHSPLIIQVNRKQCINLSHITNKKRNTLILDNSTKIKIGNKYKDNLKSKLSQYINQEVNNDI